MFFNLSKSEKITVGIIVSVFLYCLISIFFSIGTIVTNFSLYSFLSCLPRLAWLKILICIGVFILIMISGDGLDVKATTVGHGQHGNARFARESEKLKIYSEVVAGHEKEPGFVIERKESCWRIDASDQNLLLLSPPGGGKSKSQMIPTICYNAAVNRKTKGGGASMLITDCKGEELTTCGGMLEESGYRVLYLDFRYPLNSYHENLMYNINVSIDKYKATSDESEKILHYARAERYAKVLASSVVENLSVDTKSDTSQFFNETSKGLITALALLVSEYGDEGERHILSVFKLLIELNGLSEGNEDSLLQKNKLEELLQHVDNDRIMNFAGPSMKADVRTSMNIFSSALGKLVSFIDAELEQMVCDQSPELNDLDFIKQPTAIFLVCPDENTTRHFFATLFIRYMMNDLIAQATENGGQLSRKVLCLWDEFGQMPPIKDLDSLFTAVRSRGIRFLIALQSYAQLEKNYSRTTAKTIRDACQMTMFSYMSPSERETAKELSETLGNQTVQSGSVSSGHGGSQSLQMIGKPLMSPDEIIRMPLGSWIIMKSGALPVRVELPLFTQYIKKMPPYTPDQQKRELRRIPVLTGDKIRSYVTRQQATLSKGMFD